MEHQVFVPVPAEDLRAALRDPARVARCVPGLQHDAGDGSGSLAGRLRVRVGGHTVTYRGGLTVTEPSPERFDVEGGGTEVRGSGTVTLSLRLRLTPHDGGTRLEFAGSAEADGRAAGFEPEATVTAVRRLLDRFTANLAAEAGAGPVVPGSREDSELRDAVAEAEEAEEARKAQEAAAGSGRSGEPDGSGAPGDSGDAAEPDGEGAGRKGPGEPAGASVFDTDVPPPSLDPALDPFLDTDFTATGAGAGEPGRPPRPPAEAAHARRTMIGRSAEEVDHAPPRGRYAPVPAPSTAGTAPALRWIGPAAALALASAVVVGRALRRRR
ncbi:SRPBCC family protein [Streptomyces sp. NPDC048606]|uniref:SRPBCC family protein n=1 Tax=Streptomyces sp. NPDC048606 TaxID=3154726 RepID=UPI0034302786